MIRLRNARVDDPVLFELIRKELIPYSHTVHFLDAQVMRELPIRFRRGTTYVASAGKMSPPLGFVHFELTDGTLYVDMLAVHPASRNQGIGRRLIAAAEATGRSRGCTMARLFVDESNPRARRLYERLGYRITCYFRELKCYEMIKFFE